jgi:predicted secreted hydrolase
MSKKLSAINVIQQYLLTLRDEVAKLGSPLLNTPVEIPDFDTLYYAAQMLGHGFPPEDMMQVIHSSLGRAADYGNDIPVSLAFPQDHHIHPRMGDEWYWVGCTLNVTDNTGKPGRIGILVSIQKIRSVDIKTQDQSGWDDIDALMVSSIATVTINMQNSEPVIIRRAPNKQWGCFDHDKISFSKPGEQFLFKCGKDYLSGSTTVMPLNINIDDGSNMQLKLTLKPASSIDPVNSFFLQGNPDLKTGLGTGLTSIPTPGLYYSWPQLQVTGSIMVKGIQYNIVAQGSTAWVDHQMMMSSLKNPEDAKEPVPFIQDPTPINGWTWQYFNLDNGDAWTGASFVCGNMNNLPNIPYGYYIQQQGNRWVGKYMAGMNEFTKIATLKAPVCKWSDVFSEVPIPIERMYEMEYNLLPPGSTPVSVLGTAAAWMNDGTFNNPDWRMAAENPADYISGDKKTTGQGFLETVNMEPVANYRDRRMDFLKNGNFPCMVKE